MSTQRLHGTDRSSEQVVASPASSHKAPAMSSGKLALVLIGLIVAVSMTNIDSTIVSLSSQQVQQGLNLTSSGIQWIVNAYMLAAAAAFPIFGHLSDFVGYKRIMVVGTTLFALGSLGCGIVPKVSQALTLIIIARVVQGISLAMMFPAAVGILFTYSPEEKRANNMSLFFAITGAMTCLGPILGSWLVTYSWRYIFFINLPLAVVALIMILSMIPRDTLSWSSSRAEGKRMDWFGGAVAAGAMAALIVSLQQGREVGWTNWRIIGGFVACVVLFILFVVIETHTDQPIIKLHVFRSFRFDVSQLAMLVASVIFQPIMYFLSIYGLVAQNKTMLRTSLFIFYFFGGYLIFSLLGAKLFNVRGIRPVLLISGVVAAAGFFWLYSSVGSLSKGMPTTDLWIGLALAVAGAGIGFMFSPSSTDTVNRAIGASYGEVTAINQMFKNFGGALGMAVFAPLCTHYFALDIHNGLSKFGVTMSQAKTIADSIGSSSTGSSSTAQLAAMPAAVKKTVMDTIRASYATGSGKVFLAMSALALLFIVLAAFYPSRSGKRA